MTYPAITIEAVEPVGYSIALVICFCGSARCRGLRQVRYPVPPTEASTAGMAFRTHRVSLGLPKSLAADRLGISVEQLEELERGLARCDWSRARAALVWRARAAA